MPAPTNDASESNESPPNLRARVRAASLWSLPDVLGKVIGLSVLPVVILIFFPNLCGAPFYLAWLALSCSFHSLLFHQIDALYVEGVSVHADPFPTYGRMVFAVCLQVAIVVLVWSFC